MTPRLCFQVPLTGTRRTAESQVWKLRGPVSGIWFKGPIGHPRVTSLGQLDARSGLEIQSQES